MVYSIYRYCINKISYKKKLVNCCFKISTRFTE
jgi:hypothetical protein